MKIIKDTEYNLKYPERPKRYKIEDEECGPVYFTEDIIPILIVQKKADLAKWNEIQIIVNNLDKGD